jgi:uncharacterized protein (TIGR01777 family)
MSIEYRSTVDAPVEDVFAWHERPGALRRLLPPWQPVRVVREASNLRDGRAELRGLGVVPWTAQHSNFVEGERFTDELASVPFPWRHNHEFQPDGPDRTIVIDRLETPVPSRFLRKLFAYRHVQLADDIAVMLRTNAMSPPLTIAVTGASGLVGTALCAQLTTCGHRVVRLVRHLPSTPDERTWTPNEPAADLLDGIDSVVHLAGESILGRFTPEHRARVRDSRVGPTRALAQRAAQSLTVRSFICASGIGYYGSDRGDELLDETSEPGSDFLAETVQEWEAATAPASEAGLRVVQVRTGIVQSPRGGMLRLIRPLFVAGLGGRVGDGHQWSAWIDLDDLTDIYLAALTDRLVSGPINAVAPNPVRNEEYTRVLARTLHRPALLPVPSFGPKLLLGEQGAEELALASQRVAPIALLERGHPFRRGELAQCLGHQFGRPPAD